MPVNNKRVGSSYKLLCMSLPWRTSDGNLSQFAVDAEGKSERISDREKELPSKSCVLANVYAACIETTNLESKDSGTARHTHCTPST